MSLMGKTGRCYSCGYDHGDGSLRVDRRLAEAYKRIAELEAQLATTPQPDSVPQDSGERAAFEHWAFTVRGYRRGNTVQGGYISPPVNGAWEGWKAALAPKTAVATHKPLSDDERIGTYRHLKTLVIYDLVAIAHLESDKTEMVVYRSWFTGNVWLRPVAEFFDGRFERFGNPTATIEASR